MSSNGDITGKVCLFSAFYSINPLTFNDIHCKNKKKKKNNPNKQTKKTHFVCLYNLCDAIL